MKVLHLSDTSLSGSPYRISQLLGKYSDIESRHIVWQRNIFNRSFPADLVGEEMTKDQLQYWLDWADIIHYHNRYKRQNIFKKCKVPNKPGVIQIHSPREEEGHQQEVDSGLPLAIIAQYHVRQWPELSFIVPNVVDIHDELHLPKISRPKRRVPVVSYAPSSPNGRGWNNKSYNQVNPVLKKMYMLRDIEYKKIIGAPFEECMNIKRLSDIGIDEVSTGSYHLTSLEYLSMGVACIGRLDEHTEKVVKDLTGCTTLPWVQSTELRFKETLLDLLADNKFINIGIDSRVWMRKYWNPEFLVSKYKDMYLKL